MTRETWATRMGFVLAAVGSAVGLGNLWRFPWMVGTNGGSAFLLAYLAVVVVVGVPSLLAAFVLGRRARSSPVGAFRDLSGSDGWGYVGVGMVLTSAVLLSFYSVVGGWVLRYTGEALSGLVGGQAPYVADPAGYFGSVNFGPEAVAFHLGFLALTAVVVAGGIRGGIETATKWMMPAIGLLLVGLAAWVATIPGSGAGYEFLLRFDLSVLREDGLSILGAAAGQALFTLSLGAGTMITYASYLGEDRSLPADATTIAVLNTGVGVLTGLVVFPLLASLAIDPTSTGTGAGALFIGLAGAFARLPAGELVAAVFFLVVLLAALSSAISMLEIPVAFLVDEYDVERRTAAVVMVGLIGLTGSGLALQPSVFEFVAGPLVSALLTGGLAATLLFVAWVLAGDAVAEVTAGAGPLTDRIASPWLLLVGAPLPVFLAFSLFTLLSVPTHLESLGLPAGAGFWATVALAVVVAGGLAVGIRRPESTH
jgi:NSS family neurotransmitter:Na+ symporter